MKFVDVASTTLQVVVIVLISFGASYVFQSVDAMIKVNGTHVYRYVTYVATIILWYACVAKYNKYLAFSSSSALAVLAIFGQQKVIDLFSITTPLFGILMGFFTILLAPAARGRGFFEFIFMLILPALLAESKFGGSVMSNSEGIFTYEVYAVTFSVVGGYFYFRYMTSVDLMHRKLTLAGASEEDRFAISRWNSFINGMIVASATAATALLATTTFILTDALQPYFAGLPPRIFLLEITLGVVVAVIIYYFQTLAGKK